jgi:hypothetical protein
MDGWVEWRSANMIIRKPGSQAGMDIDTAQDIARSEPKPKPIHSIAWSAQLISSHRNEGSIKSSTV